MATPSKSIRRASGSITKHANECRICLDSNCAYVPIFGDKYKPDISTDITVFGAIHLDIEDNLPKFICTNCHSLLQNAITFRKFAKRADAILKGRLKNAQRKSFEVQVKLESIMIDEHEEKPKTLLDGEDIKPNLNQDPVKGLTFEDSLSTLLNIDHVEDGADSDCETKPYQVSIEKNNHVTTCLSCIVGFQSLYEFEQHCITAEHKEKNTRLEVQIKIEDLEPEEKPKGLLDGKDVNPNLNLDSEAALKDEDSFSVTSSFDCNKNNIDDEAETDSKVSIETKRHITCVSCKVDFQSLHEFEQHSLTVEHTDKIGNITPKKRILQSKDKKKKHSKPGGPKDQNCSICDKVFTKFMFPRHLKEKHGIKNMQSTKNIECEFCKKLFRLDYVRKHIQLMHSEIKGEKSKPKIKCPICKKMFAASYYSVHVKIHGKKQENADYVCEHCGKSFVCAPALHNHRVIHTNDLPYKCDHCPYRGRSKNLLKLHLRTHTGTYSYKCTQCDRKCSTKSNLKAHMLRHKEPNFICETCNKGFYSKSGLQKHISVIHLGVRDHICNICGVSFGYRRGLMSHQQDVHKRAKRVRKTKALYLRLEEEEVVLQPQESSA